MNEQKVVNKSIINDKDKTMPNYKYMVATKCFTYNQAPYIEHTLKGFVLQETSFPAVYIVVDDASTDGEPEILLNWATEYLDMGGDNNWCELSYGKRIVAPLKGKINSLFVVLLLKENHYQTGRILQRFNYLSEWLEYSKYQAMCEGDDYWIYEKKIQEQVDYMETHSTCALVHSKALVFDESLKMLVPQTKGNGFNSFSDLLKSNKVVSLTVCIRSSAYFDYLKISSSWKEKKEWRMGDYPCWLWFAKHYDVHFMDIATGVYRILPESASHSNSLTKALAFYKSNYQIQLFFAKHFSVKAEMFTALHNQFVKDKIRVYCQYGQYSNAYKETKLLPLKERLKAIVFVFLKSIKK